MLRNKEIYCWSYNYFHCNYTSIKHHYPMTKKHHSSNCESRDTSTLSKEQEAGTRTLHLNNLPLCTVRKDTGTIPGWCPLRSRRVHPHVKPWCIFPSVSDFPPIFEQFSDSVENVLNFTFSRKISQFSSDKISDYLFFSTFPPSVSRKLVFPPIFEKFPPLF